MFDNHRGWSELGGEVASAARGRTAVEEDRAEQKHEDEERAHVNLRFGRSRLVELARFREVQATA